MKLHLHRAKLPKGLIAAFGLLLWPSYASAHLVTTGLGPVYDGIGHLVMTPEDLVPALAIALFAGLRGAAPGRRALFVLPLAWFVGGLLGIATEGLPEVPVAAISFLILKVVHGHCCYGGFGAWCSQWCRPQRRCRYPGIDRYHGNTFCYCGHCLSVRCFS